MTSVYEKICIVLILLCQSTMALALENLAMSDPTAELKKPNILVLDSHVFPDLFAKYNRNFPPPRFLTFERSFIEENEPALLEDLIRAKPEVIAFYERALSELDMKVQRELIEAGISVQKLPERPQSEVPTQYVGRYQNYIFYRGWSYWVVVGKTSQELAQIIFQDKIGNKVIRTNGFAGNQDPVEAGQVTGYHIDSLKGLSRFVELVQKHLLSRLQNLESIDCDHWLNTSAQLRD
jgi:hypothetical protein